MDITKTSQKNLSQQKELSVKSTQSECLTIVLDADQQKAFDLIANTNTPLFITGKAGTGKSTFINTIQEKIDKNFLVLAPTGIAAINVGGQTMHSFFGFPFEVIGPNTELRVSDEKIEFLKNVDTIIVDEVSMVRCDWVDGMDCFLRAVFHTHMPFGGLQVVFVGDLFQLPPVVGDPADEDMLNHLWGQGTPYFYKAHVLKRMNMPKIEFRTVYRQKERDFLEVLNRLRFGDCTQQDLDLLNKQVCPLDDEDDYAITLSAYRRVADMTNERKLAELDGEEFCYQGIVDGKFKTKDFIVPEQLKLKVGAQVIFCRNVSHNCVNGTIAKVSALGEETITVVLKNGEEMNVSQTTWESVERVYDRETKKMKSKVVGTFTQYPLKLAWAITIHKSQGMTFDRMHFDLSRGTFAPGQTYVAISRMRSLEGLTLSRPIMPCDIIQNPEIRAFANSYNDTEMIDDELQIGQDVYRSLAAKDHDGAVGTCLKYVVEKCRRGDYRNAALLAKKMFDVMLDDTCLMGRTKEEALLKDCSMTCNFLNAVLCLYGGRFADAVGFANMVLDRKNCLEAMFVKERALYCLERYDEAYDVDYQIMTVTQESDDKKTIDMKQLLLEAKINVQLGNSNMAICKRLIKICPECLSAYVMLRREAQKNGKALPTTEESEADENEKLVMAFNNTALSDEDFEGMLRTAPREGKAFARLGRKVVRI
ncbi:MAG: AAA family ATPase [Bacteroidales bacterium]|nr:AAA family ATPase [Bacteroidales bacterium]